jgi:hypothetical protein
VTGISICRFMRVSVMLFLTGCSASKTAYSDPATERAMLRQIQTEKHGLGIFRCDEEQHSAAMCACLTTMVVDVMSDSEVHAVLYGTEDKSGVVSTEILMIWLHANPEATSRCRSDTLVN